MLFSTKLPLPFSQVHTIIAYLMSHTVEWWLPLGPWPTGYDLCYSAEFMSDDTENMVSILEPHLKMWCTSLSTIALGLSPCVLGDASGLLASFIGQETLSTCAWTRTLVKYKAYATLDFTLCQYLEALWLMDMLSTGSEISCPWMTNGLAWW